LVYDVLSGYVAYVVFHILIGASLKEKLYDFSVALA